MVAVYAVFSKLHQPPESAFTKVLTAPEAAEKAAMSNTGDGLSESSTEETAGTTGADGTQADGTTNGSGSVAAGGGGSATTGGSTSSGTSGGGSSGSTGSSGGASSGGSSSGGTSTPSGGSSGGGSSQPTTPVEPVSLKKGSPCQTQTPPAGVCSAILSFNSQKTGNPNWDAALLVEIKQGIADNGFVKALHLNVDDIYNSMQITLTENTWNGNATSGTIGGKMGAAGQSQDTTFTTTWNGSKWMVTGVKQN
jgi:hypothetical protein